MGGETSPGDDSSDTQLHCAFKKLKVDPEWNPSVIKGNVENLRDLWIRDTGVSTGSPVPVQTGGKRRRKKLTCSLSRMEPYPQDFLCSMAEKLTFHSEVCQKQSCMCSELRLKSRKCFNYASSSVHHRPLIREAKLKFHHSEKDTKQVLRAARLKIFKHGKQLDSKSSFKHTFGNHSVLTSPVLSSAPNFPLFGAKSKLEGQDFQSVASKKSVSPSTSKSSKTKSSKLESHRSQSGGKRSREEAACSENSRNSFSDCGKEMRCSQQAKLDDMSVDELAGYFEDFVHIPKKMSSMAEMMYT
ncbi:oxidative stress-responsive serine-rich protein 1-like [Mercenaria mercenaria]|uniref:oxidative stress-responsive serine-rich protein 1-like n=1 Tax=Mercenaria mercenaria TaxID=6596 RepID=UPI001E1DB692|nr:oxidative stress-responsive serine-rich protein 1-like [Mercenaria mercenaria]